VGFIWRAWVCLLVLVGCVAALGCQRVVPPPLIDVGDPMPRELEMGDRLELRGNGFPQGHSGHVRFEGEIARPGEAPVRSFSCEVDGSVTAPDRLEIPIRETFVERFCGGGGRAAHATFRGSITVAFASVHAGAPPLVGVRRDITLDVLPSSTHASVIDARAEEGKRVLTFLGIVPGPPTPRGIPLEQVAGASIAEGAGLRVGDTIASAEGVNVLALADIVPTSSRSIDFVVRQSDSGKDEPKTLPLVGYAGQRIPSEYEPALVIVALGCAVFAFLLLPGPARLASFEARVASMLRRTRSRALAREILGSGREAAVSALGSAAIIAMAVMPWVVHPEADGIALVVLALALIARERMAPAEGIAAAAVAALRALPVALVAALSVMAALAERGAIALDEVVRSQGAYPWQWNGMRHPGGVALAVLFGACVVALVRTTSTGALRRVGLLGASAVFAAVFLGGWQAGNVHVLVGSAVFLAKTWLAFAAFVVASIWLPPIETRALPSRALRRAVPLLVIGAALLLSARRWAPSAAIEATFGIGVLATSILFTLRLVTRVRAAAARPEPHASPFL
jgi:NADH-quinone oxidoreductase subunit H